MLQSFNLQPLRQNYLIIVVVYRHKGLYHTGQKGVGHCATAPKHSGGRSYCLVTDGLPTVQSSYLAR